MKSVEIKGSIREGAGKKIAKKLRKEGLVPCELYGGEQNLHFAVDAKMFKKFIYTPEVNIVNINVDGKKYSGVIKDAQFHPVTDDLLHVDFVQVSDDKEISIKIPVVIKGNSIGIKNGGKLRLVKRSLKVKALPKFLPDTLEIDITKLNIGQSIKVKDLNFSNLMLADALSATVVSVVSSRISKSMTDIPVEATEEAAEGEATEAAAEAKED
jgi:large subunit ribosomal protein L25